MMRKHVMAVMMAAAAAMVMAGCSGNNSEASKGAETAKTRQPVHKRLEQPRRQRLIPLALDSLQSTAL